MAGSGEVEDNPVGINVVPMVDVIFCLCVFFMCSFKFQEREGRFETWLPKDLGNGPPLATEPREIRVALYWNESAGTVDRHFGARVVRDDAELERLLSDTRDDYARLGLADSPLIVDGDPRVPWKHVLNIVNLGRRLDLARIQFASSAH